MPTVKAVRVELIPRGRLEGVEISALEVSRAIDLVRARAVDEVMALMWRKPPQIRSSTAGCWKS
jgi:hypothetical protein